MSAPPQSMAEATLRQRLARDRNFGRLLKIAAVASAAVLLAVVAFLLAGALPLLDWRGPALVKLDSVALAQRPQQLPGSVISDASQAVELLRPAAIAAPLCADVGGLRGCYSGGQADQPLQFSLRPIDCSDCAAEHDRVEVPNSDWTARALLSDQRSLLLATTQGDLRLLRPYRDATGELQLGEQRHRPPSDATLVALQRVGLADQVLAIAASGELFLLDASQQRWHRLPEPTVDLADDALFAHQQQLSLWHAGELSTYRWLRLDTPPLLDLWEPLQSAGQAAPEAVWQPHSDDAAGTPRLNLWPLLAGSLKAALLGLLFGAPLAIAAAMHSVQYRSGLWRDGLKSSFELMEAVPTVILGLIAGLWVAPWLDRHLGLALGAALGWLLVFLWPVSDPRRELSDRHRAGHALLRSVLGLVLGGWLGATLESQLPGGRLTAWLEIGLGWSYEPYNAIVVGLLVGLAISPMIFSLSEEALRRAPAGLQEAALALGASRRDTLFGLLLPAALPGIIAASLMGFGRALGETLIVLLASNNAPIADLNPLSGLRSITATLVLEAPTAVPGTVHYRVLLLATLLLMATTIGLNLLANRWRARMARKPVTFRVSGLR